MKVLMVDDMRHQARNFMNLATAQGHEVEWKPSGDEVKAISQDGLREIEVAFIDYRMHGMDGFETADYLREQAPHMVLIMLTNNVERSTIVKAVREHGFRDYLYKTPPEEAAPDFIDALHRAEPLVEERKKNRKLNEENRQLEREVAAKQAQSNLMLSGGTLIGLDSIIRDVERYLRPYVIWKNGELTEVEVKWRWLRERNERQMAGALLFEGEPGSGKSTLMREISDALGSEDNRIPKDVSPSKYLGESTKQLASYVQSFYRQAEDRRVVVIQLDDTQLPPLDQIQSAEIRAAWQEFLYSLRDCIDDAARINRGEKPTSNLLSGQGIKYQGKILWLAARNREEDVGKLFQPLADKLSRFEVTFPRDADTRKKILEDYADREGFTFEPKALERAVRLTKNYTGRALVGDRDSERGFIRYALRRVTAREIRRYEANPSADPNPTITLDIVEDWAESPEHDKIIASLEASNHSTIGRPSQPDDSPLDSLDPARIGVAQNYLKEMEEAARSVTNRGEKPTQKAIGQEIGTSGSAISQRFSSYDREIKALGEEHPDRYTMLRPLPGWP